MAKKSEDLRNALEKLSKLENSIKRNRGIVREVIDIQMLKEFIKEQVKSENTAVTIS